MRSTTWFSLVLLSLVLCSSQVSGAESEYIIGKGDALVIQIWGEESLSAQAVVRPDGRISLPGIGDMQAAGLTSSQLQSRIAGKLAALIHEPMVAVMVYAFPNNSLVVFGPGVRSAVLALEGRTTLLQVLSRVVPDNSADLENAYIERAGQRIAADFQTLFLKGDTTRDLEVKAGDQIFVPLRRDRLIFVEGAVGQPTTIMHYDGLTVLEAINMAGGFTKFADRNKTTVLRKGETGQQRIGARLEDLIEEGDFSQNIFLERGDIVVVKKSWF